MATPGVVYVKAKAADQSSSHIPESLSSRGAKTCYQYTNIDSSAGHASLSLYPLPDVSSLQAEDFKNVCPVDKDFADFEIRIYERRLRFEPLQNTKAGRAPYMAIACMEPGEGKEQDFQDWYHKQHLDMLSMITGYRRSFRYKMTSSTRKDAPTWLAIHECELPGLPEDEVLITIKTEWSKRILDEAKIFEGDTWKLEKESGTPGDL